MMGQAAAAGGRGETSNGVTALPLSVVIPCFNAAQTIARAVRSALNQHPPADEILIVDDGSSDDTDLVVADLEGEAGDRLSYVRQSNRGPSAARNHGARIARGRYLLFLDADDVLLPGAFGRFAAQLAERGELDLIYGGRIDVTPDGRRRIRRASPLLPARERNFADYIHRRRPFIGPGAAFIHRRVFERVRYPEGIRIAEDAVFYAQVLALFDGATFAEPVVQHHIDEARAQARFLEHWQDLIASIDLLFDPEVLPEPLMGLREEYAGKVMLSLFRSFHRAGQDGRARSYYHRALRMSPGLALRFAYLRKYLRGLAGLRRRPNQA